jgi:hypothetical protein
MTSRYTAFNLDSLPDVGDYRCDSKDPSVDDGNRTLSGLGRINLFVGRNNSGKSRLLRALYKAESYQYATAEIPPGYIRDIVEPVRSALRTAFDGTGISSYNEVSPTFLDSVTPGKFLDSSSAPVQLEELRQRLRSISRELAPNLPMRTGLDIGRTSYNPLEVRRIHDAVMPSARDALKELEKLHLRTTNEPRVYIPVLRGLRPLSGTSDVYEQRTRNDYGLPTMEQRTVFTGLGLYSALDMLMRGTPEQREVAQEYARFLSAHFFEGVRIDLTPRHGHDVVHIRIGTGSDFPVFNLGDGIQSIIVLTFSAFAADSPSLFMIEEPEQHLHPGMQRRLLELYARESRLSRHQYFLTTHSNHLLDMAIDDPQWSTFVYRRVGDVTYIVPLVGQTKLALHELGARASSVFLTNASIWVEGVTDRLYLRAYLRKFFGSTPEKERLREDTHYSFIEYGGANITHFDFGEGDEFEQGIRVAAVCSASFVVADGDIEKRAKRVAVLRASLGDQMFVLKCKEVENLLPAALLRRVAVKWGADPEAVSKINETDYQQPDVGLGRYLDETLGTERFAAQSGTVKQKVAFCDDALREMGEGEWELTAQARELCDALVSFIRKAQGK